MGQSVWRGQRLRSAHALRRRDCAPSYFPLKLPAVARVLTRDGSAETWGEPHSYAALVFCSGIAVRLATDACAATTLNRCCSKLMAGFCAKCSGYEFRALT